MAIKEDIIQVFEDYATSQGWDFWFGSPEYLNALSKRIDKGVVPRDTIALGLDFNVFAPTLNDYGRSNTEVWNLAISLSRKYDVPKGQPNQTYSNRDEYVKEKWDLRIYPMMELITNMFQKLTCATDREITAISLGYQVNVFDTNMDGPIGTFTITNLYSG